MSSGCTKTQYFLWSISDFLWIMTFIEGCLLSKLSLQYRNIINHYFCDEPPLLKMACDDTKVYELIATVILGFNLLAATAVIMKSYIGIVAAIIRIRSAAGRGKAFSTCSAHLVSVSLFYGTTLIIYSTPQSYHTPNWDKANALFYTVVNPLVNPLIYSLRNKDVAATAVIMKSYIGIVAAIIHIHSAAGRGKAFFTCSAHLVSVSLFYGTMLIIYSTPKSYHTPKWDKANALFYTVVNPLVNPLIYSLRNKDVKAAFKKVWGKFTAHK